MAATGLKKRAALVTRKTLRLSLICLHDHDQTGSALAHPNTLLYQADILFSCKTNFGISNLTSFMNNLDEPTYKGIGSSWVSTIIRIQKEDLLGMRHTKEERKLLLSYPVLLNKKVSYCTCRPRNPWPWEISCKQRSLIMNIHVKFTGITSGDFKILQLNGNSDTQYPFQMD